MVNWDAIQFWKSWAFSEGVVRKILFVWTGGSIQAWKGRRALRHPELSSLTLSLTPPSFVTETSVNFWQGNFTELRSLCYLPSWYCWNLRVTGSLTQTVWRWLRHPVIRMPVPFLVCELLLKNQWSIWKLFPPLPPMPLCICPMVRIWVPWEIYSQCYALCSSEP